MSEDLKNQIKRFLSDIDQIPELDILDNIDIEEIDLDNPFDSIRDMLEESNAFDIEVIYYERAITYLSKNDPSLRNSLQLAYHLGFNLINVNSELLASILASEKTREEFYELKPQIDNFFEQLEIEDEDGE